MVLEATLICVDNSEWTRNGDFTPTRFEAQQDAANLICGVKTNSHIENSVGILTLAGDRADVRVTPTNDLGQILAALHKVKIQGNADVIRGIQTAQLALKHRPNKNQRQRIICFVASPVVAEVKQLETLGKQLKKNNVALDIVSFGEVDTNSGKLKKLHEAVNSNETSHFLECPAGAGQLLSDMILSSPVVRDGDQPSDGDGVEGEGAAGSAAAGGGVNQFGVDPNIDPDLYLALRISLEEEQARTQRENAASSASDSSASATSSSSAESSSSAGSSSSAASSSASSIDNSTSSAGATGDVPMGETAPASTSTTVAGVDIGDDVEMDEELRAALLLSMQDYKSDDSSSSGSPPT